MVRITREDMRNLFRPSADIFMDTVEQVINYRYSVYKSRSWWLYNHWGGITKQMIRKSGTVTDDDFWFPDLWDYYKEIMGKND